MKRILFVDDEQQVLDGLRDLLRKDRGHWDMVFALGGAAALEEMAMAPFDVVVSDMRMPGMDGPAFLQKVKERYPATARIVLSGHAEQEMVLKALPVSQQYLSKPCDVKTLREVVERSCALQVLLSDPAMRALVGNVDKLPSVPGVYRRLTEALANPNTGVAAVADIIEQDPALSAKILQIVNSAFFGLRQPATSIARAISYLGLELIKSLTLTTHVFAAAERVTKIPGFSIDELQRNSLVVAEVAKRLVRDQRLREEAFTAGLLRDVGKIVMAMVAPAQFAEAFRRVAANPERRLHDVEKELVGVSHAEVGAFLLGTWGLPLTIVSAVAYHHAPAFAPQADADLVSAVHIADALAATTATGADHAESLLDLQALEQMGVSVDLAAWRMLADKVRGDRGD